MSKVQLAKLPETKPLVLGVDLETTSLDPFSGRILSVALSDGEHTWLWLDFHGFDGLKPLLQDPDVVKIVHNGSFDLLWIKHHLNIDVVNAYDTLLAEKVLTAGKNLPAGLYDVVARRCGKILDKTTREEFHDHPGFKQRPITTSQITYMIDDVVYLPAVRQSQLEEAEETGATDVLRLEMDVLPILVDMEYYGVKLDVKKWWEYQKVIEEKVQEIESAMRVLLGSDYELSVERTRKGEKVIEKISIDDIKWNSPSQIKALLNSAFDLRTVGRKRLTADEKAVLDAAGVDCPEDGKITVAFIESLRDKADLINNLKAKRHRFISTGEAALLEYLNIGLDQRAIQFINLLLEHRKWSKMAGWGYDGYVHPVTGKVHPNWRQMGADTGRMSCGDPNLQNVPRPREGEPNFRRLWVPDSEDYLIICADYAQQEPRILAQLCQDKNMLQACNSLDVYIEFAKYMFGRTVEKGSEERYIAKQFVLAVGYGAGPDKLHATSGLPLDVCEKSRDIIRNTFPDMIRWARRQYEQLQIYGYTTTRLGRRRYFPEERGRRYTLAVNTPVQGTAADMMKAALVDINRLLTKHKFDARIWLTVHDEVEVMVHRDQAEELKPLVVNAMQEAGQKLCPDVLCVAEADVYSTWDK